jgi:preprotein translocase subunit SecE
LGVRVPPGLLNQGKNLIGKVTKYLGDVKRETGKVIWPSRKELQESAVIVVVLSLILAVFVFGVDFSLNNILKLIF